MARLPPTTRNTLRKGAVLVLQRLCSLNQGMGTVTVIPLQEIRNLVSVGFGSLASIQDFLWNLQSQASNNRSYPLSNLSHHLSLPMCHPHRSVPARFLPQRYCRPVEQCNTKTPPSFHDRS